MNTQAAPIVVFAYNRAATLARMLDALAACKGFAESPVRIYVDGPKGERDRAQVEEVRALVRSLGLPNVEGVIREKNLGLKQSVYDGVTEVCRSFGRVIVLEDDLLLSPVALEYFNAALEKYADAPRVWSVVGYQYDAPALKHVDRALVLPYSHTWGWATWWRAWGGYDMNAPVDPRDLASDSFRTGYDGFGTRDFRNMLELQQAGLVDCWFSPWNYKIFLAGGLNIHPPRTYVTNIGIRAGGTHSSCLNPYYRLVRGQEPATALCRLPEAERIDYWAMDAIRSSWDARVQMLISHLGRVKRLLFKRKAAPEAGRC